MSAPASTVFSRFSVIFVISAFILINMDTYHAAPWSSSSPSYDDHYSPVSTLPRSGRPAKMTATGQRRILNEVKKNPRASSKDLHKSLKHANISVDESTIRKTLNKNVVHGRTPLTKPQLSKKTLLHI